MKRTIAMIFGLACVFSLASCKEASAPPATPIPTAQIILPSKEAEPTDTLKIEDTVISEEEFKEGFIKNLNLSIFEPALEHTDKGYVVLAENMELYGSIMTKYEAELKAAASLTAFELGADIDIEINGLSKQMIIAIAPKLAQIESLDFDMLPAELSLEDKKFTLTMDYSDNVAVFSKLEPTDTEAYLNMRVRYGYMLTVYDDEGNPLTGEQDRVSIEEWVFPLPKYTRFRDTWFGNRDKGTRRHLGTDISAPENTEIYSCTDAEVIYVGTGRLAGNCVYTRDKDGNEYMYCHMVRVTDFLKVGDKVKKGEVIGHVGNTGNSAVNHLHLTVILKDGRHLHTFPYLKEAWTAKRIVKPQATVKA